MKEWALRNKTWIGFVTVVAGIYVTYECPGLSHEACKYFADVLKMTGSFLAGAGVLPSDLRERFVQGRVSEKDISEEEK